MALKDHSLPNGVSYLKLADYPDDEEITVKGIGIATGTKYGDQAYLVSEDGERITLPGRYVDYARDLMLDDDALKELSQGARIKKGSYEYDKGKVTPTFDFI